MTAVIRPATLVSAGFDSLAPEADAEGHRFRRALAAEWRSGTNRFKGPGEALCGAFQAGGLIAVGGLDTDPYLPDPGTARLRHVYVRPVGVEPAWAQPPPAVAGAPPLRRVRLHTGDPDAGRLHERRGFERVAERDATHAPVLPG